ncbi:hypothetical protein THTE_0483 [Thermogutta terrifontis]|uniref:Uncharacterized protein n=1 Tax=Thermogutta terrifontis TaxID=1331910 RepID=A0A286RAW2_9BACT|nr:hypothetical protein THTE_0483 [Thermogutta terrifontis]
MRAAPCWSPLGSPAEKKILCVMDASLPLHFRFGRILTQGANPWCVKSGGA